MTTPLLECRQLTVSYSGKLALDEVNLAIREGDCVGVIGPNGAGKSTLIKALSGLLRPSAGTVFLDGRDIRSWSKRAVASQVAVIQQEETSDFGFTVREEVMMGRSPHHRGLYFEGPADIAIAEDAMRKTGIEGLADRRMDALSGGERRRARIARGLAQQPRILLLDEPTNHLDLHSQLSLIELTRAINQEGMAILAVSHDINFISELCAQVKILHEGRFQGEGPPHLVITEENLERFFRVRALVDRNPVTSAPRMTPLGLLKDSV